jgi:hypothetical protein
MLKGFTAMYARYLLLNRGQSGNPKGIEAGPDGFIRPPNRYDRRRRRAEQRRLLCAIAGDSGGCCSLEIIRSQSDPHPTSIVAIQLWIRSVFFGRNEPVCFGCETVEFSPDIAPDAFLLIAPLRDRPTIISVSGLCEPCAKGSDDQILQAAVLRLKKICPTLRVLPQAHMPAVEGQA